MNTEEKMQILNAEYKVLEPKEKVVNIKSVEILTSKKIKKCVGMKLIQKKIFKEILCEFLVFLGISLLAGILCGLLDYPKFWEGFICSTPVDLIFGIALIMEGNLTIDKLKDDKIKLKNNICNQNFQEETIIYSGNINNVSTMNIKLFVSGYGVKILPDNVFTNEIKESFKDAKKQI